MATEKAVSFLSSLIRGGDSGGVKEEGDRSEERIYNLIIESLQAYMDFLNSEVCLSSSLMLVFLMLSHSQSHRLHLNCSCELSIDIRFLGYTTTTDSCDEKECDCTPFRDMSNTTRLRTGMTSEVEL
ncbi:unnamed protein product [Urochloa humidicola]